jgi:Mn2+/Fe2+ NRAMP family transporter
VSAIVLVVISGVLTLGTCIVGLPSLVMAILALTKQETDPEGSRRLTRWGWITLAILFVLAVLAVALIVAVAVTRSNIDPYNTY